ncbi:MAG: histidine--tRNA ligase [Thermoprotei archaeon]
MSREYIQPPRGMRDIVGIEAEIHEYLVSEFTRVARLTGFKPVIPPTVEYSRLFEAKSGVEIRKSMYVFKDKAGRLLALRPEVTASVIRIYLKKLRGEVKPIRLYYIAQCFRYEEPQYARYREFWQAGLEVIGDPGINGDLSVAYTASTYLDNIGVKHYYVIGNIAFHRILLSKLGIDNDTQDLILHYIDKSEIEDALKLLEGRASEEGVEAFKKLLDTPLNNLEDYISSYKDLFGDSVDKLREEYNKLVVFRDSLRELGYRVEYSPLLVRGLAYYTGLIYEYKTEKLKQSIGGGGRYDGLTTIYGGPFEYSTGLALGLDRIALALEKTWNNERSGVVIISLENTPLIYSYMLLKELNKNGLPGWILRVPSIKKGLSIANRKLLRYAIIIGDKEYKERTYSVKDLVSGEQWSFSINELIKFLKNVLHDNK